MKDIVESVVTVFVTTIVGAVIIVFSGILGPAIAAAIISFTPIIGIMNQFFLSIGTGIWTPTTFWGWFGLLYGIRLIFRLIVTQETTKNDKSESSK